MSKKIAKSLMRVFGPFDIPFNKAKLSAGGVVKHIDHECGEVFWKNLLRKASQKKLDLAGNRGCYIFAMSVQGCKRNNYIPWYVGKAASQRSGFEKECFELHKLEHYCRLLFGHNEHYDKLDPRRSLLKEPPKKGKPVMLFVCYQSKRKGRINHREIGDLEKWLTSRAVLRNPDLLNIKNIGQPKWCIEGVVRGGKAQSPEKKFRNMMGIPFDKSERNLERDVTAVRFKVSGPYDVSRDCFLDSGDKDKQEELFERMRVDVTKSLDEAGAAAVLDERGAAAVLDEKRGAAAVLGMKQGSTKKWKAAKPLFIIEAKGGSVTDRLFDKTRMDWFREASKKNGKENDFVLWIVYPQNKPKEYRKQYQNMHQVLIMLARDRNTHLLNPKSALEKTGKTWQIAGVTVPARDNRAAKVLRAMLQLPDPKKRAKVDIVGSSSHK